MEPHRARNRPNLLLLAASILTTITTVIAAKHCPNCGNIAVPYPLSTAADCGDQSYKIRCQSGELVFDSLNNTYPISAISKAKQQLVIEPARLSRNTCVTSDFAYQGLQLNSSLPFNITGGNTVMFLNCSSSLLRSPLNCSASSLCHVYVNSTEVLSPCARAPVCCTFRAGGSTTSYMIRVRSAGCKAYTSFVDLDPELPVDKWPDPGVEIQWALPQEPTCRSQVDCDRNSRCQGGVGGLVRRCYCNSGLVWDPVEGVCASNSTCNGSGGCDGSTRKALIAGLASGFGGSLVLVAAVATLYKRHRRIKKARERLAREREEILSASGSRAAKLFTGKEIKKATNNFSGDRLLGIGGYGEVYRGILNDGTVVAVKCAKVGNTKGTDQVLNEVRILCQVNHRSLVSLLGCCVELEEPIMVYEYIQNGALLDHLHGRKPPGPSSLTWRRRLQIAHDTADGLAYLHSSAVPPIYHRDVKSSNILLDEKLNAKVSDFGLSRLAHGDLSHISTCAQGTLGYLDPEYYRNYQLTDKSDVYSFGVVLSELLTSQKAIDFSREEEDVNLAVYMQRMVEEEKLMDVIDPVLKHGANPLELETIKALALLALSCLEEKRNNRPSMKEVAEEIEYIMSIVMENQDH